ncbi:hypothetical protein FOZ61_007429 [Perkinsus olseni]|uniref:Uncharacterized protein n=1 Tax=Perkinsus olseni TaxID=32597 RepID=A0A7J6L941_PEROL|nr:hypothetical protein FOZ61_007429 [Perkinsus olseni]KAF4662258.1 hypothetical protein FOL46_005384 [Perkinsus olseni]
MTPISFVAGLVAVLTGGGLSLEPAAYCAYQFVRRNHDPSYDTYACMYFHYYSERKTKLVYNYFGGSGYILTYDNVTFEDDKIILRRQGLTEGPELYPYFEVGFDLLTSPASPDVVHMVARKGLYNFTLTKDCRRPPRSYTARCAEPRGAASRQLRDVVTDEKQPKGDEGRILGGSGRGIAFLWDAFATTLDYITGEYDYTLDKKASGEIFRFETNFTQLTFQFFKIDAEFVYYSAQNAVYFVPNNKSNPRIKLTLE